MAKKALHILLILSGTLPYSCEGFTPLTSTTARTRGLYKNSKQCPTGQCSERYKQSSSGLGGQSTGAVVEQPRRWHRKMVSRVLRRSQWKATSPTSSHTTNPAGRTLSMQHGAGIDKIMELPLDSATTSTSIDAETQQTIYADDATRFILQEFEHFSPEMVFPPTDATAGSNNMSESSSSSASVDISVKPEVPKESKADQNQGRFARMQRLLLLKRDTTSSAGQQGDQKYQLRGAIIARIAQKYMKRFLNRLVHNLTVEPPQDLNVQCIPRGNVLARLCRGYLGGDAKIDFGKTKFQCIRVSSGSLEARKIGLNLLAFRDKRPQASEGQEESSLSDDAKSPPRPRYQHQFEFHADDVTFTSEDLFESPCIRNGLQRLFFRVLANRGIDPYEVKISSIDILSCGKISCIGEATPRFGASVPFEVRTSLGVSSHGHVLTFPGLAISIGPSPLFPMVQTLDLDIGHNAKLRNVVLDGKKRTLKVSASATITPLHTMKLSPKYSQSGNSYAASFSVDVGRWLTNIGNFAT